MNDTNKKRLFLLLDFAVAAATIAAAVCAWLTIHELSDLKEAYRDVHVDMVTAESAQELAEPQTKVRTPALHVAVTETTMMANADTVFPLTCGDDTIAVPMPESEFGFSVSYDSAVGVLDLDADSVQVQIRAVPAESISEEDILQLPVSDTDKTVWTKSKKLSDSAGVSVTAIISGESAVDEAVIALVQDISDSAGIASGSLDVTVAGNPLRETPADVVLTDSVFAVLDDAGDVMVSFAPFTEELAYAEMDTKVALDDGTEFLKGNYTSAENELTLYVWKSEAGNLKVLAKDDDAVKGLFDGTAAPADDAGEADEQDAAAEENADIQDSEAEENATEAAEAEETADAAEEVTESDAQDSEA